MYGRSEASISGFRRNLKVEPVLNVLHGGGVPTCGHGRLLRVERRALRAEIRVRSSTERRHWRHWSHWRYGRNGHHLAVLVVHEAGDQRPLCGRNMAVRGQLQWRRRDSRRPGQQAAMVLQRGPSIVVTSWPIPDR